MSFNPKANQLFGSKSFFGIRPPKKWNLLNWKFRQFLVDNLSVFSNRMLLEAHIDIKQHRKTHFPTHLEDLLKSKKNLLKTEKTFTKQNLKNLSKLSYRHSRPCVPTVP